MDEQGVLAPPANCFPPYPASWFLFCRASELRKGPVSRRVLGRDLAAFRTGSGRLAVLNARCSHLGANLGRGDVVGETIRCPFHHWRFDSDGRCVEVPGQSAIPRFALQQSYPAVERHGFVFFFNGAEALFPLPFFSGENPDDFTASRPFAFIAHCNWYMLAAQGFDTQHFETVHDRRLERPPETDSPTPFARRNRYSAQIVGMSRRDRLLCALAGPRVTVTIVNWAGAISAVKAEFGRACNRFLALGLPLENGQTLCEIIVFARRGLPALSLPIRRWFTRGHLVAEARRIRDTEYLPSHLISADADMIDCFRWLAGLPQQAAGRDQPTRPAALQIVTNLNHP